MHFLLSAYYIARTWQAKWTKHSVSIALWTPQKAGKIVSYIPRGLSQTVWPLCYYSARNSQ